MKLDLKDRYGLQKVMTAAYKRVAPYIHRTPILTSKSIDEMTGVECLFKCENFQKTGSFKMRGAANAVFSLSEEERARGVVTHSSGNFAQAVAKAAQLAQVPAYIVMPDNAPKIKREGVRAFDGQITLCEATIQARESEASRVQMETGANYLHPSNQIEVIIGQGTATMEVIEDYPEVDVILPPIGGGGLIGGAVLAAKAMGKPGIEVWGGEPEEVDDAYRSLQTGKIEGNKTTNTIADGLRTTLGDVNFPIILEGVKEIITVSEEEIIEAMRMLWNRLKIIIEPSCAVPFAALIKEKDRFKGKKVAIILTGGNVDIGSLPF
jgi:threonine dehydratase